MVQSTQHRYRRRPSGWPLAMVIVLLVLNGYFLWMFLWGPYGYYAEQHLTHENAALTIEREKLIETYDIYQRQENALDEHVLDQDLLDINLRAVLGVLHRDERLILLDDPDLVITPSPSPE